MKYVKFTQKYLYFIKDQVIPVSELPVDGWDCVVDATEQEYHSWMFLNY